MTDVAPAPERKPRTAQGALLRSGLDAITRMAIDIPEGQRGRIGVAVELEDGTLSAEIGAAWLTKQGWQVDATVSAAVAQGQRPRLTGALQVTW